MAIAGCGGLDPEPHPQRPSNGKTSVELDTARSAPCFSQQGKGRPSTLISRQHTATCWIWGDEAGRASSRKLGLAACVWAEGEVLGFSRILGLAEFWRPDSRAQSPKEFECEQEAGKPPSWLALQWPRCIRACLCRPTRACRNRRR